ncbi:hypothetical protein BV898_05933 [Hypsibius exemplaris]|uniref:Uncharacterized protein n=1 Tax=Hypsibius exemplaris TaxID=2072580 RepID=A0A1W0WY57_HYPEX|nr:hypothetical protein BV898_05933 [Hypsibius exemplaris]
MADHNKTVHVDEPRNAQDAAHPWNPESPVRDVGPADVGRTDAHATALKQDRENWGIETDPDVKFHPMMHRED